MRDRNAGQRRRRDRARHAGHHVEPNPRLAQSDRFLAAPAEDERVAALEPHDAAAAPRRANHDRVNLALRERVTPGALANEEALCAPRQPQHPRVDERVVQHEIGRAQPGRGLPRQQSRIAGPGADERDMPASVPASCACRFPSARAVSQPAAVQDPVRRSIGDTACSALREAADAARTSARRRGARCAAAGAPRAAIGRDRSAAPHQAPHATGREAWRCAVRGNRQGHAVPAHDAAQKGRRVRRIVDRVHEDPLFGRSLRHAPIDLRGRGRHHQPGPVEIRRLERRAARWRRRSRSISSCTSGDTTNTSARTARSWASLAAATGPPPTSTTRRLSRFTNSGSRSVIVVNKKSPESQLSLPGLWSFRNSTCVNSRSRSRSLNGWRRGPLSPHDNNKDRRDSNASRP